MSASKEAVGAIDKTTRMIAANGDSVVAEYRLVLSFSVASVDALRAGCSSEALKEALPRLLEKEIGGDWIVRPGGDLVRANERANHGAVTRRASIVTPLEEIVFALGAPIGTFVIGFSDDGARARLSFRGTPRAFMLSR